MLHLHSPTLPSFVFPLLTCPLIGSFHILHAPPSSMAFSPFLSAVSHSSADLASVDFDWLPDSSIKLWNSEVSNSCGDGSPTSPPQPLTFRRPTNRFLLDQSFGLLNPSLQTTNNLLHRTFSSSSSSPPPPAAESLVSRPLCVLPPMKCFAALQAVGKIHGIPSLLQFGSPGGSIGWFIRLMMSPNFSGLAMASSS